MAVRLFLQQGPNHLYTNLDTISGKIQLSLYRDESFSSVTVKLECESRTRLAGPRRGTRNERYESELEVHKLLYKTETLFPTQQMQQHSVGQKAVYTLPAGNHEWPFKFKIPFNNACAPLNSIMDKLQMSQDYNQHIKRPLPPTLTGFPGMCEIRYYVKVTCARSSLFRENFRAEAPFLFMPIEPIRSPPNRRESYARRQHQFMARRQMSGQGSGMFKKQPKAIDEKPKAPVISIDGRLPDPAIVTCNRPLPLRLVLKKVTETTEPIFLNMLQIMLIAHTKVRAHELLRTENTSYVILSKANFQQLVMDASTPTGIDIEIDASAWSQSPLPNMVCPSFETCNISRWYELRINIGLSHGASGTSGQARPEMTMQELHMPCKVYSGIEPPTALIEELFKRQSAAPQQVPPKQAVVGHGNPSTGLMPQQVPPGASGPAPAYSPPAPGVVVPGQAAPRPEGDIPDVPPPSYEDAMADEVGPVDGPRTRYEQPQTAPLVSGDEKRSSRFGGR